MSNNYIKSAIIGLASIVAVGCEYDETPFCYHGENNVEAMIPFEELLASGDFDRAANEIASDFRCEMGLPKLAQLGIVVEDVEGTARDLESQGFDPFFIAASSLPRWDEKDESGVGDPDNNREIDFEIWGPWYPVKWGWIGSFPFAYWGVTEWDRDLIYRKYKDKYNPENLVAKEFKGKNAFGNYRGIDIEIVAPGTGSDFYRKDLDSNGRPVIQHIGFLVNDVDDWAEKFHEEGYELLVRGRIDSGPLSANFVYMDTVDEIGYYTEFIAFTLNGETFTPSPFYKKLGLGLKALNLPYIDVDDLRTLVDFVGLGSLVY